MKTLIIGGGISGLSLAEQLEAEGYDYQLLEASDRFGGRIMTSFYGSSYFDLGPAWFWQGQPRIAAMINRFQLKAFEQFSKGALIFENEQGQVQTGRSYASMEGSWRLEGGLSELITVLCQRIPESRRQLNSGVVGLEQLSSGIKAYLHNGTEISADRVVLAMPPRIAAKINFSPALPTNTHQTLLSIPTWMAGQAKVVAIYPSPFWREMGLSGDAMSRHGPLVEIHDASPKTGGPYALFGFIGTPPASRVNEQRLKHLTLAQLERLFGQKAAKPSELIIKDWALDTLITTDLDQAPMHSHPHYHLPHQMKNLWEGKLLFTGTEVAAQFGGYIEGALEAAEYTASQIRK